MRLLKFFLFTLSLIFLEAQAQWMVEGYQTGLKLNGQSKPESKKMDWIGFEFIANVQIVTAEGGVKLRSADGVIWIGPQSEVLWKAQAGVFELKKGLVRSQANIKLQFELGECQWDKVNDLLISWDPVQYRASWKVLAGQWSAPCFEFESQLVLNSQVGGAEFLSDKVKGQWVFDELASGKRMPRGVLKAIDVGSSPADLQYDWSQLEQQLQQQKKPLEHTNKKKPPRFCSSPEANPGQCVYRCQNSAGQAQKYKKGQACSVEQGLRCLRSTCSVEGLWVDHFELSSDIVCPIPWDRASQCF